MKLEYLDRVVSLIWYNYDYRILYGYDYGASGQRYGRWLPTAAKVLSAETLQYQGYEDPWEWASDFIGLTDAECTLMFSASSRQEIQKATLDSLKAGRRLDIPDVFYLAHGYGYKETTGKVVISGLPETADKIQDFLGMPVECC